jgi:hypothetical protein
MKKIDILKKAVSTIVGIGTAKIVKGIIESNVSTETVLDRVTVSAASAAIGGAVGQITSEYTNKQIDEMVALIQKIKNRTNSTQEED